MSILINKNTKVICQGFTGSNGTFHSEQAKNFQTNILIETLIMDIESIVSNACFKVLNDCSVGKNIRAKRAKALIFIGKIFSQEKSDKSIIVNSVKEKINL